MVANSYTRTLCVPVYGRFTEIRPGLHVRKIDEEHALAVRVVTDDKCLAALVRADNLHRLPNYDQRGKPYGGKYTVGGDSALAWRLLAIGKFGIRWRQIKTPPLETDLKRGDFEGCAACLRELSALTEPGRLALDSLALACDEAVTWETKTDEYDYARQLLKEELRGVVTALLEAQL